LIEAHEGFKEAHSSILSQRKEPIEIASLRVACHIIDESFYLLLLLLLTPLVALAKATHLGDGFTCDSSLIVENEILKKEVLTHALGKAYDGEAHLLKCLESKVHP
jgi:hypothetical protein